MMRLSSKADMTYMTHKSSELRKIDRAPISPPPAFVKVREEAGFPKISWPR